MHIEFGWEDILLKHCEWIIRWQGMGDGEWSHVAQVRDQRRALVNTMMNLRVP
jgi:hypothetical protein